MSERRTSIRSPEMKTGRILLADAATASIDCAVLDISEKGACLLVRDATKIPTHLSLAIDGTRGTIACYVVWKTGNRVGVQFSSAHDPG